ncbi:MAG: hypothetical protein A2161_13775 [Candidatus Schekmanbacteria bacterium RBG_13_48_7]|uniref:Uncharacterized protein n=1 Tax=Candidatus Schekmanbacteria bacterium RBG_13_48_7 TaxID=1817878 RepID=A0A1F7RZZ0_9BACT|nr:MAG: hypothetical protein A2161_13775 [Candidatus Schekmanbacteria bacterium RBG_13_48_7]
MKLYELHPGWFINIEQVNYFRVEEIDGIIFTGKPGTFQIFASFSNRPGSLNEGGIIARDFETFEKAREFILLLQNN